MPKGQAVAEESRARTWRAWKGGFADLAVAVVDAALRESVLAAAIATFGVEFVERDDFSLGREFGKIDAGEVGGADGVLDEDLAGVVESFHSDVADGQAEKRADFGFVETWIAKAFVFLNDAAFRVEHEGGGKSRDAAVLHADFIWGERHGIVDTVFFHDCLDGGRIVIVDDEAENLEAVFVFGLEIDEIVKLRSAGSAPGGPEIQKDDFAFGVCECDGLAVEAGELEVGGGIGVAHEADGGLLVLGGREGRKKAKMQRSREKKNKAGVKGASHGVNYRRAQWTDDAKRAIEIPSQQFTPSVFCNDMLRQSLTRGVINHLIANELAQPRIRAK